MLPLLLCGTVIAEMQWLGLNPSCQAGNAGDSGQVTRRSYPSGKSVGSYDGFEVEIRVVDSIGGDGLDEDSSYGTWYTTALNTEDVVAATGLIELISITDSSTETGGLFAYAGGDSTFVRYTVKTGYIPYDPAGVVLVYDDASLNVASGTALRDSLIFNTAVGDTLFKPWTWVEITCWDSTTVSDNWAGPYEVTGTPVATASITAEGAWGGGGTVGRYYVKMFGCADDEPDSIISTFYGPTTTIVDTTAVTAAAQAIPDGIDSGVTVTFDDATTGTDDDVFMFHVSDSLHLGKTVKYKIRAGLNVQRR